MGDLVLSIEQCKRLKELGLDMSDAKLCRVEEIQQVSECCVMSSIWKIKPNLDYTGAFGVKSNIPTYTLQEVWRKIPNFIIVDTIVYWKEMTSNAVSYTNLDGDIYISFANDTELNNAHNMLCWVIKFQERQRLEAENGEYEYGHDVEHYHDDFE